MATKRKKSQKLLRNTGRILRKVLYVLGSTLCGLGAGSMVPLFLLLLLTGPIKQDGWGAAPVFAFCMLVGGIVGAIIGCIASIRSILYVEVPGWTPFEWLGLLAGSLVSIGLTLLLFSRYYSFMKALILAAILPPCALAGRVLTNYLHGKWLASQT
jgi:hypothetical protein